MKPMVRGVAAGYAGTIVMSVVMLVLKRAGMEPGELEPRVVAGNVEEKIGVRSLLSRRAFEASWIVLHFGYGSASGAAYVLARKISGPVRPALAGPFFGALLWALGYCGWLPLFGLYPPPTRVPKRKVAANIIAHIAYGTTTAAYQRLEDE
ncbi:MAG: DUF1440 domain-containing protein [Actinomycetota bacterium]|nr:DUF1440 domain-containing protein [Actinomycetota bacterium]